MNKRSTEDLIAQLGAELRPVQRLTSARWRAGALVGATALVVCAALLITGGRSDLAEALRQPSFIFESLMMLTAAVAAAIAACHLAVPDTRIRLLTLFLLGLSSAIWAGLIAYTFNGILQEAAIAPDYQNMQCVEDLTMLAVLPVLLALVLLARAAPVWRGIAGYAGILAVASISALGMRLLCGNDDFRHLLLWHFLPVLGFALLGVLLGKNLPIFEKK